METFKAKFIKIEIDGITYAGFLQEVKEAATETAASVVVDFDEMRTYLRYLVFGDALETHRDIS